MKNIVVVADKKARKKGRKFVHLLSKVENVKASLYNPQKYEDNEQSVTGNNYVIFLGKNKVSKDYIPLIDNWSELKGVRWGYDYRKALIYIKTTLHRKEDFENLKKELEKAKSRLETIGELAVESILGKLVKLFILTIVPPKYPYYPSHNFIFKVIKMFKQEKIIKQMQYDLGLAKFLEEDLEDYLDQ